MRGQEGLELCGGSDAQQVALVISHGVPVVQGGNDHGRSSRSHTCTASARLQSRHAFGFCHRTYGECFSALSHALWNVQSL